MNRRKAGLVAVLAIFLSLGAAYAAPGVLNVMDFGATGDGVTDDSGAIQDTLDAASAAGGGIAMLPAGDYLLESPLAVASGVTLQGVTRNVSTAGTEGSGSRLLARTTSGLGLLTLASEAAVEGLSIFYPDQTGAVPYPPAITCDGGRTVVRWVHLVNPWIGLAYTDDTNGHLVRGVTGQPLDSGIYEFPGGRLEAVSFKQDWDSSVTGDTGIILRGSHAAEVFDCSIAGFNTAILLCANFNVLMTNVTAWSQDAAVLADESTLGCFAAITNGSFQGRIVTNPNCGGGITFTGCQFERGSAQLPLVQLQGVAAITFKACAFSRPAGAATADATVQVAPVQEGGAPLIITSCVFDALSEDDTHVRLSSNVREAVIGANIMTGAINVVNDAPAQASVEIANNAVRAVQP
jgi:hypothetical protein